MSTHFPPSQSDGAADRPSEPAPHVPFETPRTGISSSVNPPVSPGQRRGWNTATGIIGGLGALSLLLGGAGAATAAVMTQERTDTWTASSEISHIVVDSDSANVRVLTSPTAEHVEVKWQEVGWGLGDARTPQESDGVVHVDTGGPSVGWNSGINNIEVTVPADSTETSLDLTAQHGLVHVTGSFDQVRAESSLGSVSANALKANALDARTTSGQVLLDGVEVRDRLDAHTRNGFTSVNVTGAAPGRTAVTAESGVYELKMPTADYWYPSESQQHFADPRSPETDTRQGVQRGESFDSRPGGDAAPSPSPRVTPGTGVTSEASRAPSNTDRDESGIATAWSSEQACSDAPGDRPCLFVAGEALSGQDSADMRYWREEWNSAYDDALTDDPWDHVTD